MDDLAELFRHNAWANDRVFGLAASLDADLLAARASGTRDTVADTLKHLAQVESGYLALIEQRPLRPADERTSYQANDLAWFVGHVQQVGAAFIALIESDAPRDWERDLQITWFDFPVTARQGLYQVLTHSAQHRSQVLSWLSGRGIQTPDLDYVLMLQPARTGA